MLVQHRAQNTRLFVDFFQHKGLKTGALGGLGLKADLFNHRCNRQTFNRADFHAIRANHSHFTVIEIDSLFNPVDNGRHIAGDKIFIFAQPDNQRTAFAGAENSVRLIAK